MTKIERNIRNQIKWAEDCIGCEIFTVAQVHVLEAAIMLKAKGHNLPDAVRIELTKTVDSLYEITAKNLAN